MGLYWLLTVLRTVIIHVRWQSLNATTLRGNVIRAFFGRPTLAVAA